MKKRFLALLLCVMMCVGLLPTGVFASIGQGDGSVGDAAAISAEETTIEVLPAEDSDEVPEESSDPEEDASPEDEADEGEPEENPEAENSQEEGPAEKESPNGDADAENSAEDGDNAEDVPDEQGDVMPLTANDIMTLSDADLSTVSALTVSSYTTGTDPFDEVEGAGNDTSADDDIVRSFDYIEYSLGYTTALRDAAGGTVEDGYLMVEFTLPVDPSVAEFDMSTLNWCLDEVVTYYYEDGTSSTTWDTSKTVKEQVLTGMRYLSNSGGQTAIPGSGSLSVGIYVKAAANGEKIQPTFTVYMEGNDVATEAKTVEPSVVTVSAAPKYNIRLYRNSLCDALGYFDLTNGTMSSTRQSEDDVYGRIEGYGIVVQLYNDSADKGLKGIELPTGKITFTVELTTTVDEDDMTTEDGYHPLLWDYEEATAESVSKKGKLGRTMAAFGVSRASYAYLTPGNKAAGATDRYCYDGGSWSVTQNDNYSLSVTLDGSYLFDVENFTFPEYGLGDTTTTPRFGANVGSFSSGYIQVIAAFPEDAAEESTQNFVFDVKVTNMSASSVSGKTATEEMDESDNESKSTLTMYPSGSISKWNWYRKNDKASGSAIDNGGSSQDGSGYGYQGETIQIASEIKYDGDLPLTGYNILQKFDDEALKVLPTEGTGYSAYSNVNSNSTYDSITVLYAAKPDGSGWSSDTEMKEAKEENLIYFTSLDALESAGYTCIGFLYEVRGTFYAMPGTGNYIYMRMEVLDTAEIGSVYQTVNTIRAWQQGDGEAISWTTVSYNGVEGAYGWGNTNWKGTSASSHDDYYGTYTAPTFIANHEEDYVKSVYENGTKSGHTNANQAGDSLLIIGDKTTVSIVVTDTTETSTGGEATKTTYDLDKLERTVTYEVTPSISAVSENREVESSDDTDNVTVTITLPKGLTYDVDSATVDPNSITQNDDGTTTIVWTYDSAKVGEDLESFTFTCTIGAAGTADDVVNEETLTIKAEITSDKDSRESNSNFGNVSETTISVIRLAASSVSKSVDQVLTEEGEDITFNLHYANESATDQIDDELMDILPYNGDGRGTSFTGSYQVTRITVDLSDAEDTWEKDQETSDHTVYIEYTTDTAIRGYTEEEMEALMEEEVEADDLEELGFKTLTEGNGDVDAEKKTITWDLSDIEDVTALYIRLNDICANEYVTVSVTLSVKDEDGELLEDASGGTQRPGDVYANDFCQYYLQEAGVVTSNIATTTVVRRSISGLAWIDANANGLQDSGETPLADVTVTLYSESGTDPLADGDSGAQAVDVFGNTVKAVTTDHNGTYSFEDLPAGAYTVEFADVNGYIYQVTEANVGSDDTIDSDAEFVSNEDGDLTAAIYGLELPALEDMTSSEYAIEDEDAGFSYVTIDIEGTKEWDDADDQDGKRPATIDVYLLADGERVSDGHGNYIMEQVAPDGDGNWTFHFTDLARYHEDGTEIVYSVEEISITDYETTVGEMTTVEGENNVYSVTITNTHEPETIKIAGSKAWDDAEDQDGKRPPSVVVYLLADGQVMEGDYGEYVAEELTAENNWSFSFTDLPRYKDGAEIQYNIVEIAVDDYSTDISIVQDPDSGDYTVSIINSYTPEQTSVTVVKAWNDDDDRDGLRPESVTVELLADGESTEKTLTLDDSNNWQGSFTDLDRYTPVGQEITYTVQEIQTDGYNSVITGSAAEGYVITNSHDIETISIMGVKVWNDENDQDGARPESIIIRLWADSTLVETITVTEKSGWMWSFTDLPKYENGGQEIIYTVTEDHVDDYSTTYETIESTENNGNFNVVITNSYTPEKTSVTVLKVWEDSNDQDGLRPGSVTVELLADSVETGQMVVLSENNNWLDSFTDLDRYANGVEIVYTVKEVAGNENYTVTVAGSAETAFVVTNNYETETIDIEGSKTWDDNGDQDGARPESITIYLLGDGKLVSHKTVTEADNWSWAFTGLPKYDNGEEITYQIVEQPIEGYTPEINGYDVTNIHTPDKTSVTVSKVWMDNNDKDGLRPDSVTVTLLADGEETGKSLALSEENNWQGTFTDLDEYSGGDKIKYTVEEIDVDGYVTKIADRTDTFGFVITNTHEPETISIEGTKFWEDADNQDGIRPNTVDVILLADGEPVSDEHGNVLVATISAENDWSFTFTDLPRCEWEYGDGEVTGSGVEIVYTVAELTVDGYETVITGEMENGFRITNTHEPETIDIEGVKTWDDENDQDGKRPESVTIRLWADGEEIDSLTVTAETDWAYQFEGMPKYANGVEIQYAVTEDSVDDYSTKYDGYDITNSYTPEQTSVTVVKVWDDADDQDGLRPGSVTVELLADGRETGKMLVLNDSNYWIGTFTGLDVYADGKKIVYTVEEVSTQNGYTVGITGDADTAFVVTNTHEPETIDIEGSKTWDDNDDQDGARPDSITIYLLADGKLVDTRTVTAADGWSWSFENLPKYDNGSEITYQIAEHGITDYTPAIDGYDITNTHTPGKTSVTVSKVWIDNNNEDGTRPESITVTLLADGEETGKTLVLSDENGWQGTFTDLDEYSDGVKISYTVEEIDADGYDSEITGSADTFGFVITNTHEPETIGIEGVKIWDDADDQDGIRPGSIEVYLLADGEPVSDEHGNVLMTTVSAENNWSFSFTDLPKYEWEYGNGEVITGGVEIVYTVAELTVDGYETVITGSMEEGYEITNTHEPETIDIEGVKTWDDANDQDGKRPASVTIRLWADGEEADSFTATADTDWVYHFEDLPKYANGTEIQYTVTEDAVEDYSTEYNGYDITNSYTPEQTSVTVVKVWEDGNDADAIRPEDITVTLLADGEDTGMTLTLSEENNWIDSFTELDVYRKGVEIVYTVAEISAAGYATEITGDAETGFIITNTHTPFVPEKSVNVGSGEEVSVGDELVYTITWENNYNSTADVVITDTLEVGLDFVSASDNGVYDAVTRTVTWTLDSVEDGAAGTVTLTVRVNGDARVVVENDATVQIGHEPAVTVTTDTVENPLPDKSVETDGDNDYQDDGKSVAVGSNVIYRIDYYNPYDEAVVVIITDTLDEGLTFGSASSGGEYNPDTNTIYWEIDNVQPGEKGSVTFIAKVNENALVKNEVDNTASVKVGNHDAVETNPVENPVPEKSVDVGNGTDISIGEELVYTIEYQNGHSVPADVVITDVLENGLDFISASDGGVYDENTHTVTWTFEGVEPGGSGSVTLTVQVNENAMAVVENTATVKVGEDHAVNTNPVENPLPSKSVETDGNDDFMDDGEEVSVGSELTYKIDYYNSYDEAAVIVITDALDEGLTYVSSDPEGSYDAGSHTITWVLDDVQAGAKGSVTFTARVNMNALKTDEVENTAYVQIDDHHPVVETNTVVNPVPSKTVEVGDTAEGQEDDFADGGEEVAVGDRLTYTIDYENGHETEAKIVITDTLDVGLDFVSASDNGVYDPATRTVTWTLEAVEAGAAGSVTLVTQVNENAKVKTYVDNTAYVKVGNDPAVSTNPVENPLEPDDPVDPVKNEITVGDGAEIQINDTLVYTITYYNHNNVPATVTITDELDEGLDFVSATNGGTYSSRSHTVTWTIENVPAFTEGTVTLVVQVNENAKPNAVVENTAGVQIGNDPVVDTNTIENPYKPDDPTDPEKTVDVGNWTGVSVGDELVYTITYYNYNNVPETVTITDVLDKGLDYIDASDSAHYSADTRTVTWTIVDVPAFTEGTVTLTVQVNENARICEDGAFAGVENTAGVQIGHEPSVDTNTVVNPVSPDDPVDPEKTVDTNGDNDFSDDGEEVLIGDEVVYSVSYYNYNNHAVNVVITDTLDKGVDFVSASDGGVYDEDAHTVTWTIENVPAFTGGSVSFTVDVNRDARTDGKVVNTASVQIGNEFAVDTNETDNPLGPDEPEDPVKSVDVGEEEVEAGETLIYTIHYYNHENTAEDIVITDTLDEGLDFVEASDGGTYRDRTRTVTWTLKNVPAFTEGIVTLVVQVNDIAWGEEKVDNVASVQIGNNFAVYTNMVENPLPVKSVEIGDEEEDFADNGEDVAVGSEITYRITYKNEHSVPMDIVITDTLDVGLDFVEASDGGVYDPVTRTVTWTLRSVEGLTDGSVTLTVLVNENARTAAVVENTASVQVGNDPAVSTNTVENPVEPDEPTDPVKSVDIGEGTEIQVNDTLIYTITYYNYNNVPATVTITDELDYGLDFVSASNGGKYARRSHTVTWTIEDVPAFTGGSVTLTVQVNEDAKENVGVENTAGVQIGNEPSVDTNTVENPYKPDDPTVPEKTVDVGSRTGVSVGDTLKYTITYYNNENVPENIVITDILDDGVDFLEASDHGDYSAISRMVTWTIENVPAFTGGSVTLTVQVNENAKLYEEGEEFAGVGNEADVQVGNNAAMTTNIVENPVNPDDPVNPEKAVDTNGDNEFSDDGNEVAVGSEVSYAVSYYNNNNSAADIVITDVLDEGVDFVSASDDGSYDANTRTVTWTLKNVPAFTEGSVTLTVQVNDAAKNTAKIENGASVQIGNEFAVDTNAVVNPLEPDAATAPEKSVDVGESEVEVGDELVYTITYYNNKNESANIVITDVLDDGLTFVEASDSGSYKARTNTVTWTLKNVPAFTQGSVTLTVQVNEDAVDLVENTASVQIGDDPAVDTNTVVNPLPGTTPAVPGSTPEEPGTVTPGEPDETEPGTETPDETNDSASEEPGTEVTPSTNNTSSSSGTSSGEATSPQTGDASGLWLFAAMFLLCGMALAIALLRKRRSSR